MSPTSYQLLHPAIWRDKGRPLAHKLQIGLKLMILEPYCDRRMVVDNYPN